MRNAILASGVFAIAPYIGFLAPVAALSVGLPFIIGYAVFSVVAIALSYAAISKNKTISEKEAQLADEKSKVEAKGKIISEKEAVVQDQKQTISELEAKIQAQEQTISGQNDQLTKKEAEVKAKEEEISKQKIEINKKNEEINNPKEEIEKLKHKKIFVPQAIKDIKTASEKAFTSTKEAFISGRVTRIVKDGLKDVYGTSFEPVKSALNSFGSSLKNTCDTSIELAKGTISSVGNKLQNVYNTMSSAESARNWVPSLKTIGWIAGGAGLLVKTAYITVNGGLSIAGNSLNVAGNSTNGTESDALISNSSSVYYRPTDQQIKQSQVHEINKKLADTNKWYEDNYGTPKEDSLSNKGIFSSICNKVSSVWGSLGNLASGSNKDAHDRSEPQWYKDLYKSETMEEIIDGGILGNLFSPRVDNGINTSKQRGTFIDSVELKRLTKELPPSAYPNGSPRIL